MISKIKFQGSDKEFNIGIWKDKYNDYYLDIFTVFGNKHYVVSRQFLEENIGDELTYVFKKAREDFGSFYSEKCNKSDNALSEEDKEFQRSVYRVV